MTFYEVQNYCTHCKKPTAGYHVRVCWDCKRIEARRIDAMTAIFEAPERHSDDAIATLINDATERHYRSMCGFKQLAKPVRYCVACGAKLVQAQTDFCAKCVRKSKDAEEGGDYD